MGVTIDSEIIVVGAGNAGLCAAIAAAQRGSTVLVLEKAERENRGGNSSLTLNMRFAYDGIDDLIPLLANPSNELVEALARKLPTYPPSKFFSDIMSASDHMADITLARILAYRSKETIDWLHSLGHRWVYHHNPLANSLSLYFEGYGFGLQQRSFGFAEELGVRFNYGCRVVSLDWDYDAGVIRVSIQSSAGYKTFTGKSVILASGGFEANSQLRSRFLGASWSKVKIRGVPYNTGDGLLLAMDKGAASYGNWESCHASPQDIALPESTLPSEYGRGHSFSRYSYPYGIMVNKHGKRFVDEGENSSNLTYAKIGKEIMAQPGSIAFQIFDSKTQNLLAPGYTAAQQEKAMTLEALAMSLGIDPDAFVEEVALYNSAIGAGQFMPNILDNKNTIGLSPPKSNWAIAIDAPPYLGFPVICGLTFTYGGLRIDDKARVIDSTDEPMPGLYAAGEIVGGLFYGNYPGGSGMMAGSVFGRIAGQEAARYVGHA